MPTFYESASSVPPARDDDQLQVDERRPTRSTRPSKQDLVATGEETEPYRRSADNRPVLDAARREDGQQRGCVCRIM